MDELAKTLIRIGIIITLCGVVLLVARKLGLGTLPGNITFRRGNFQFSFPIVTSLVLSIVLTILFNLFFRR